MTTALAKAKPLFKAAIGQEIGRGLTGQDILKKRQQDHAQRQSTQKRCPPPITHHEEPYRFVACQ
jgi:hypothetical protein